MSYLAFYPTPLCFYDFQSPKCPVFVYGPKPIIFFLFLQKCKMGTNKKKVIFLVFYRHVRNLCRYLWSPPTPNTSTSSNYFLVLFTNPSARAGYDTRSIFKRSLTGLIQSVSIPLRLPPRPRIHQLLRIISLLGRWSTRGSDRGIAHFFIATRNTIKGMGEQTNKRTIRPGLTQSARRGVM